jgi:hypothetical protein
LFFVESWWKRLIGHEDVVVVGIQSPSTRPPRSLVSDGSWLWNTWFSGENPVQMNLFLQFFLLLLVLFLLLHDLFFKFGWNLLELFLLIHIGRGCWNEGSW